MVTANQAMPPSQADHNLIANCERSDLQFFSAILPDYYRFIRSSENQSHDDWHQAEMRRWRQREERTEAPLVQEEPEWGALAVDNASVMWPFRVAYVIIVHFFMSLHNGFIDPRLRLYSRISEARMAVRREQLERLQQREQ